MDKPEPKVLRIELERGAHRAVVVLYQYAADAFTIHAVERRDLLPLSDDDHTFKSVSEAVEAAKKMWYATLPA